MEGQSYCSDIQDRIWDEQNQCQGREIPEYRHQKWGRIPPSKCLTDNSSARRHPSAETWARTAHCITSHSQSARETLLHIISHPETQTNTARNHGLRLGPGGWDSRPDTAAGGSLSYGSSHRATGYPPPRAWCIPLSHTASQAQVSFQQLQQQSENGTGGSVSAQAVLVAAVTCCPHPSQTCPAEPRCEQRNAIVVICRV